jgi:pSer/pThr/pTyr-binding forkhead associated (FHA) protein
MCAEIILKVEHSDRKPTQYVFDRPAKMTAGRSEDCDIRLARDAQYADVSRHHCVFEINPPHIGVRDLGSRNGTFVNGTLIGQRQSPEPAEEDLKALEPRELNDGDEVRVGGNSFKVEIVFAADVMEPTPARRKCHPS